MLAKYPLRARTDVRVLILNGSLPTYYLKQVAQEAVARIEGIARIENRIEVVSPSRRTHYHV